MDRLPFLGKFSWELSRILRPFELRPAYYNTNTVGNLFAKLKDPIPRIERGGAFRVACKESSSVYIGMTSRQLEIRLDEHKKAWEKRDVDESAFADHFMENGHTFRERSGVLLHKENPYFKRLAL